MAKAGVTPVIPKETSSSTRPKTVVPEDPNKAARDQAADLAAQARADALAAEKRANARADADKRRAGKRYLSGAQNLEGQARAIENALKTQFGKNLKSNLADVGLNLKQQVDVLTSGAKARGAQFVATARDNEKATADALMGSAQNMTRERADAMAQLVQQGAGETDTMRSMLMAARNMQANASEANRSYFDTVRSINTGITDLNVDTKTALSNMYMSAEQERDRLYTDYYSRRGEAYTQLGNIRGQQQDLYEQAGEMGVKAGKGEMAQTEKQRDTAYGNASKEIGNDYKQKPLPDWVKNYKGQGKVAERQSNTNLAAAVTIGKAEKAEGASLRRWEG
jgi:hypothetical protein